MPEHNTTSGENQAQREREERQRQGMTRMAGLVLLLVGVLYAYSLIAPAKPAAPAFYWPEPTPYVSHTEVNIFSGNKLCIGQNVNC